MKTKYHTTTKQPTSSRKAATKTTKKGSDSVQRRQSTSEVGYYNSVSKSSTKPLVANELGSKSGLLNQQLQKTLTDKDPKTRYTSRAQKSRNTVAISQQLTPQSPLNQTRNSLKLQLSSKMNAGLSGTQPLTSRKQTSFKVPKQGLSLLKPRPLLMNDESCVNDTNTDKQKMRMSKKQRYELGSSHQMKPSGLLLQSQHGEIKIKIKTQ